MTIYKDAIGGDHQTATFIVAASDSLHPERADYVCDGVDDPVEIQAAIDALPASGGKVLLLEGTFTINALILDTQYLTFEGMGNSTILNYSGTGSIHIYHSHVTIGNFRATGSPSQGCILIRNGGNNCHIHDITATTTDSAWAVFRIVIATYTLNSVVFERCIAIDCGGTGFANSGAGVCACTNITYRDCQAINCGKDSRATDFTDGFIISQGLDFKDGVLENCLAERCWECGFGSEVADIVENVSFLRCRAINNGIDKPSPSYGHGFMVYGSGITFADCEVANNAHGGIYLSNITDGIVVHNKSHDNGHDGIYVVSGTNCVINENIVKDNTKYGIHANNISYVKLIGNICMGNGFANLFTPVCTNPTLLGNECYNGVGHGIYIWQGSGALVKNNHTHDNTGTDFYLRDNPPGIVYSDQYSDLFMDVLAVSATHIRPNEDLSEAIPNTFTIDAQPDIPRTLSWAFDTHAQITEYDMEIIGVDAKGNTVTETWDETAGWSGETSNAFATITSIKMTSRTGTGAADTMDIGITDVLGLSNVIYATSDVFKIKKNTANATVAGAQVNTTYDTYDMAVIGLAATDDFTIWYRSNLNIIS